MAFKFYVGIRGKRCKARTQKGRVISICQNDIFPLFPAHNFESHSDFILQLYDWIRHFLRVLRSFYPQYSEWIFTPFMEPPDGMGHVLKWDGFLSLFRHFTWLKYRSSPLYVQCPLYEQCLNRWIHVGSSTLRKTWRDANVEVDRTCEVPVQSGWSRGIWVPVTSWERAKGHQMH